MLTFNDLEAIGRSLDAHSILKKASTRRDGKTIFLSHSSKDAALLPAVVRVLEAHGGWVYVDLNDNRLPDSPCAETGRILRETIAGCRKLALFITTNSKDSKWAPWELGVADGQKSPRHVALFPAAENFWENNWAGREYLGLYDRIVWNNFTNQPKEWLVLNPHKNSAVKLAEWISN